MQRDKANNNYEVGTEQGVRVKIGNGVGVRQTKT